MNPFRDHQKNQKHYFQMIFDFITAPSYRQKNRENVCEHDQKFQKKSHIQELQNAQNRSEKIDVHPPER